MRLLYVHDRFGALAGAEVNVYGTASELKRRGHSIALLHGQPTGFAQSEWNHVFAPKFALNDVNNASVTHDALRTVKPQAVYVHKMPDLGVLQALAKSGLPLVRMVHDHDLYCLRSYKYFPLTRTICTRAAGWYCVAPCGAVLARQRNGRWPFRWKNYFAKRKELRLNQRFHRLVVASEYMKVELLRNGFDASRIRIHAPVPELNGHMPQSSFDDRNRIVYAGQIIRGKGVDILLESLVRVRVPFECLILGDGNFRPQCERLARSLGLSGKVFFKGYMPPEDMLREYAVASVAVMSSVWPEPFGAAGLEAMQCGLPVVAFDCGGIREWLVHERNGFLVPWMDRSAFAGRIEQLLLDKPKARQMGVWGKDFARDKFNFHHYISALEKLFANVIDEQERSQRSRT